MEQTELESSFSLWLIQVRISGGCKTQHVQQVLDGLLGVICLREGLCEQLVGLNLLLNNACLLAEIKESLSVLNGAIKFSLSLVNHTDLLVALSFGDPVLSIRGHVQALFVELERHVIFVHVEIFFGNLLVDANQVLADHFLYLEFLTVLGLLESRF